MDQTPEPAEHALPPEHPAAAKKCRFNPWLFFGALVTPGIATTLSLRITKGNDYGELTIKILIVTSVIAGVFCGVHFARSQGRLSPGLRWAIGIVAVLGCAGGAFAIGIGGCSLVYQF